MAWSEKQKMILRRMLELGDSTEDISKALGKSAKAVNDMRRKMGLKSNYNPVDSRLGINWDAVDWSRTNSELSRHLGCDRVAVGKHRKLRGMPNPEVRHIGLLPDIWSRVDQEVKRRGLSCPGELLELLIAEMGSK